MKRRVGLILLLLVAGAVINVAVAWALAIVVTYRQPADLFEIVDAPLARGTQKSFAMRYSAPGSEFIVFGDMASEFVDMFAIPCSSCRMKQIWWSAAAPDAHARSLLVVEEARGWPLVCLRWTRLNRPEGGFIDLMTSGLPSTAPRGCSCWRVRFNRPGS